MATLPASLSSVLLFLLLLLAAALIPRSSAEIKSLTIVRDDRSVILFEKFGFRRGGAVSIAVSGVSVDSSSSLPHPYGSLLGFFLLSDESLLEAAHHHRPPSSAGNTNPDAALDPNCVLYSPYVNPLFTFGELSPPPANSYNSTFPITHPDEYSLYFANCAPATKISMSVTTAMFNTNPIDHSRDYLSAGASVTPTIYAFFAAAYTACLAFWLFLTLVRNRAASHRIHHLMSGLLLVRALYLLSAAEDQHFLRITGTPHGWDVAFYLFQLLKGVLFFAVIILIGTGWSFLKPFLQEREKKVLMAVIPLQITANFASAVVGETGPFLRGWVTWNEIFLLVDVACCCAVLFPIIWSIRSLRETSKTDGKAAKNLAKLTLFRKFYIVVVGYLYFTRIIVFALRTIASYKYRWVSVFAEEAATLAFYWYMFYMFRPLENSAYFALDDDEEEIAAAELRSEEFEL